MPLFEYKCRDCGDTFELLRSAVENDAIACPNCGFGQIDKLFSAFASQSATGGKSCSGSGCGSGSGFS